MPRDCSRVLDVGCGAGQVLIAADIPAGSARIGTDHDVASMKMGRAWDEGIGFASAVGEHLPFQNGSFDLTVARASLPYMDVRTALDEMARVTRPGGMIWLTLFDFAEWGRDMRKALSRRSPRRVAFELYRLLNGMVLHVAGRTVRVPLGRRRCESIQTEFAIRRSLERAGFERIHIDHEHVLVVHARRRTA